ncbi:DUF5675 family protein [Helicobacter vulpis]|uniref:DUF5675 family protein n=1 Tax=Helicobacter vulpis TaxID=2316076 RepID=UPI000EAC89D6|nr:DUF5675 family protein [Helicobacter vulpis]
MDIELKIDLGRAFKAVLQRDHISKKVNKRGQIEAGTLGRLWVCDSQNKELFSCYTMENAGTPTDEGGLDKPIIARTYTLHWADSGVCVPPEYQKKGAKGRNKALWLHDPNNPKFAHRRIMIHVGNDAIDSLGCILLGKGYNKETGCITQSKRAVLEFYQLCDTYGVENFQFIIYDLEAF